MKTFLIREKGKCHGSSLHSPNDIRGEERYGSGFFRIPDLTKLRRESHALSLSLGCLEQEPALWLVLMTVGQKGRTGAAGSAVASTLFSKTESVFLLLSLINY